MAGSYLEQFLESIQTLPCDLTRNLTLIHNLDVKVQDFVNSAEKLSDDYVKNANELKPDDKKSYYNTIMGHMDKAQALSEEKKELAHQIYNMVDKHIRRLDTELGKFDIDLEADIKEATTSGGLKKKRLKSSTKEKPSAIKSTDKSDSEENTRKRNSDSFHSPNGGNPKNSSKMVTSKELIDMEVDPNEPLYCICHQVSFGEMVGCDDPDCLIEWFHFACVGLVSKPKGKWYCPQCTTKRKNKQT